MLWLSWRCWWLFCFWSAGGRGIGRHRTGEKLLAQTNKETNDLLRGKSVLGLRLYQPRITAWYHSQPQITLLWREALHALAPTSADHCVMHQDTMQVIGSPNSPTWLHQWNSGTNDWLAALWLHWEKTMWWNSPRWKHHKKHYNMWWFMTCWSLIRSYGGFVVDL